MAADFVLIDATIGKITVLSRDPKLSVNDNKNWFAFNAKGELAGDGSPDAPMNAIYRLRNLGVRERVLLERAYGVYFSMGFNWAECGMTSPLVSLLKHQAKPNMPVKTFRAVVFLPTHTFEVVDYTMQTHKKIWTLSSPLPSHVWTGAETDYLLLTENNEIQANQAKRAFMGRPDFAKKFFAASANLLGRELRPEETAFIHQHAQMKLAR